jgi:hypothetical protein
MVFPLFKKESLNLILDMENTAINQMTFFKCMATIMESGRVFFKDSFTAKADIPD